MTELVKASGGDAKPVRDLLVELGIAPLAEFPVSLSAPPRPLLVYTCFAPDDTQLANEFSKHLAVLEQDGLIQNWNETLIAPSHSRESEIDQYLGRADIVLFLVSADFLASEHCDEITARALSRQNENQTLVIPVLLRPCMIEYSPLAHLRSLPAEGRAVTSWKDRDDAWTSVALDIRRALDARPQTFAPAPFPGPRPYSEEPSPPTSGPRSLFSWIHISDLYFGYGDASSSRDQILVNNALRADIRDQPPAGYTGSRCHPGDWRRGL